MSTRPRRPVLVLALSLALVFPALAQPAVDAAQLRGVLLEADGSPAVGYQVALRTPEGDLHTSAPTRPDGSFAIAALPPATYRLAAFAPDGTEFPVVAKEVTLRAGQVQRVEIRLGNRGAAPGRTPRDRKGGGWWSNAGTGRRIAYVTGGALALVLAGSALSDDDDVQRVPVSPSAP